MTPEGKVKAVAEKVLKRLGAYYFFPATGGYGRKGVPDIIACYKGRFIAIECKAGKNKTTKLQQLELAKIKHMGGVTIVFDNETITGHELMKIVLSDGEYYKAKSDEATRWALEHIS